MIAAAAAAAGIPFALLKATVAVESGFVPKARRGEPQIGDASYGLTQILESTARAEGFTGPAGDHSTRTGGLYDPATNLRVGARFLAAVYRRTGEKVASTASAYNGGFRQALGFGSPATAPVTVCVAWKASAPKVGRTIARDCERSFTAQPGQYGNQPHVDRFVRHFKRYGGTLTSDGTVGEPGEPGPATAASQSPATVPAADSPARLGAAPMGALAALVAVGLAFYWWPGARSR